MFLSQDNTSEIYWNGYRLLEERLLKLTHSILFDDNQMNVYSSELADIINSTCIKIESISKDIFETHILPFQLDNDIKPESCKCKDVKKWTRKSWKYDYDCLREIDKKYSLCKRAISIKLEKFNFHKYGSHLLPFYNLYNDSVKGGKWEYSEHDITERISSRSFIDIPWCESYQALKHNYIESIQNHGTIKNAIMTLGAYYILLLFNYCLPFKQFEMKCDENNYQLDFDSKIFVCSLCNFTVPDLVVDSESIAEYTKMKLIQEKSPLKKIYEEQNILEDEDNHMFFVTLSKDKYRDIKALVDEYCLKHNINVFDISPYKKKRNEKTSSDGQLLYDKIKNLIFPPYSIKNIKVTFNIGKNNIYKNMLNDFSQYEFSKYYNRKTKALSELKNGDVIDIKVIFDGVFKKCILIDKKEDCIKVKILKNDKSIEYTTPISNIIYITKNED